MPDSNLKRLNELIRTISKINKQIVTCHNEKKLFLLSCQYLAKIKCYKLICLGLKDIDSDEIVPLYISGSEEDFVKSIRNVWTKYKLDESPISIALKKGLPFVIKDFKKEESPLPWDKVAKEKGFLSAIVLPLKHYDEFIGTLHIYSDIKNYFIKEEIKFLNEFVGNINIRIGDIKNEKKLTESKKEYKELFNRISSCVAIYEVKNDGNDFIIKDFNKAARKVEKVKKEDIIGKNVLEVFPNLKDFGLFDVLKRVYRTGKPENYPLAFYKDKRISGWKENFIYKLPNGNVVAAYSDLTNQKKAEESLRKSEEKFRMLTEKSITGIYILQDAKVVYANPSLAKIFGYLPEAIIGKPSIKDMIHPDDIEVVMNKFKQRLEGKIEKDVISYKAVKKDGSIIYIELYDMLIEYQGRPSVMGTLIDITERKIAEEMLQKSEGKYRLLTENTSDVIWVLNLTKGKFTYISPSIFNLRGLTPEEAVNESLKDSMTPESLVVVNEIIARNIDDFMKNPNTNKNYIVEVQQPYKNGEIIWVEVSTKARYNTEGQIEVVGVSRDITSRKHAEAQILNLSFHDHLTSLYNRRFFEEEIKRLDTNRQLPLSFIMADLNGLKIVNDAFGHTEGDKLLKEVSKILKKACRSDDILARWGGDEFVIILPKTSRKTADDIMQRIKKECAKTSGHKIPLSLAIGVAAKTEQAQDAQLILIDAESNMYKNKLIGKESLGSSILSALVQALYEKSAETKEHTDRIQDLAIKLGKEAKLATSQLDELSLLATLHDIGKVAIPETILLKKGSLTEKEWEVIKRHPEIGFNIASSSAQIAHIAQAILCCHENWDGTGYPQGLKGNLIPVISRIILIVDAYDVMTSGRIYKRPMSKEAVIEELKRCTGSQFDPVLVEKFIEIISK